MTLLKTKKPAISAPNTSPNLSAASAASTATTTETIAARTSRLAGEPGSSSRRVWPPSSGRIGSRLRRLQPSVVKIAVLSTAAAGSDSTPTPRPYASRARPATMPTAGPASEIATERSPAQLVRRQVGREAAEAGQGDGGLGARRTRDERVPELVHQDGDRHEKRTRRRSSRRPRRGTSRGSRR